MKQLRNFVFCDQTQTFRSYPENHWVASLKDGQIVYDSWDSAIVGRVNGHDILILWGNICKVRKESKNLPVVSDRTAVIVKTGENYGVQFWPDWALINDVQYNTDGTTSLKIALLRG